MLTLPMKVICYGRVKMQSNRIIRISFVIGICYTSCVLNFQYQYKVKEGLFYMKCFQYFNPKDNCFLNLTETLKNK